MAKIKIVKFEIVSLLSESKKIIEYLQKTGATQFENIDDDRLIKYKTQAIVEQFRKKYEATLKACDILKGHTDGKAASERRRIHYSDYRLLGDRGEELASVVRNIIALEEKAEGYRHEISRLEVELAKCEPWKDLDITMASRRTAMTDILIGSFPQQYTLKELKGAISDKMPEADGVEVEIVSSEKLLTCAVVVCCKDTTSDLSRALAEIGFTPLTVTAAKYPSEVVDDYRREIDSLREKTVFAEAEIKGFDRYYDDLVLFSGYLLSQMEKYSAVESTASGENVFCIKGYIIERQWEEVKFHIENTFTAQMEIQQPTADEDIPVLIENGGFAGGVESVTNMYSPPSSRDIDPNPIMAFFYYLFFGLMLSDGGYGLLMVIFSFILRKKKKGNRGAGQLSDMAFYCGVSATLWGALFGSWFGDLIPTVFTEFLGTTPPQMALWLDPTENSITILLMSFILGIAHLFAGLGIRFFMLIKEKNYMSAFFDILPVAVFVAGFAISGGSFFTEIPGDVKRTGLWLLAGGAVAIVLTSGRSAKNIFGKIGLGLYGLYNTASGYLGDILSYSRLLALSLVTGVIASVINALGAMTGNVILFALIFILGHGINLAINLIGTYVHCCRLQYVEFFSKFYEGGGKTFTPFRINSKYFTLKEDN